MTARSLPKLTCELYRLCSAAKGEAQTTRSRITDLVRLTRCLDNSQFVPQHQPILDLRFWILALPHYSWNGAWRFWSFDLRLASVTRGKA